MTFAQDCICSFTRVCVSEWKSKIVNVQKWDAVVCVCVLSHSRAEIFYWNTFFIFNSDYFVISLVITVRVRLYIITAVHWCTHGI